VDSQAATANFHAVQDEVVGFRTDAFEVAGFQRGEVFFFWPGKGVVDGVPFVFLRTEGEEWKVGDPKEFKLVRVDDEFEQVAELHADAAEDFADGFPLVCAKEDEVAFFYLHAFSKRSFFFVAEKFDDGGFPFAVLYLDVGEALGAVGDGHVGELLDLAGGDGGEFFCVDGLDDAAFFQGAAKDFKAALLKDVAQVYEFQAEAQVGFVA